MKGDRVDVVAALREPIGLERAHRIFAQLDDAPEPDLDEALNRARRLVSSRVGILRTVEWVQAPGRAPRVPWARVRPSDTTVLLGQRALNDGNAVALDRRRAAMKAMGESVERYAAGAVDPDRVRVATWSELSAGGERALHPDRLSLFTKEQFPSLNAVPFGPDTPCAWVDGWSFTDDAALWIPALWAWMPFRRPDLPRLLPAQVSSGLSAHTGRLRATLGGLLEVLERDAFMAWWRTGGRIDRGARHGERAPDVRLDPTRHADLIRASRVPGYRLHLRLVTRDIPVPIVVGVFRSEGAHRPVTVCGASAALDGADAVRGAVEEALLSLHGLTEVVANDTTPPDDVPHDLMAHVRLHALDPAMGAAVDAALATDRVLDVHDLPNLPVGPPRQRLDALVGALDTVGLQALAVDLTPPDLESAGFRAVRALIPGAIPLDVDHAAPHLRCARQPPGPHVPFPHPFP